MGKALDGIRVLDATHVQSGPSCTQLLAWLGADVIKIEKPGSGDVTRIQLRDIPAVDSLYFAMLNCGKRGITLDLKAERGKEIFTRLLRSADVLVENFSPGAMDRLGFTWPRLKEINTRLIYASIKGARSGRYSGFKAYECVAQAIGGAMSTTGFAEHAPTVSAAQIGDSGTGIHLVAAILAALYQRTSTDRGQRVTVGMQEAVINLCRVKLRDQQRIERGPLTEYLGSPSGAYVPRAGNASGGGHPGCAVRCSPGGPNDYVYVVVQPDNWAPITRMIGREDLLESPEWSTPEARLGRIEELFALVENWTRKFTKFHVVETFSALGVPCGPVLSTRDLLEDDALAESGTIVQVEHPERGTFKTVGSPLQLSDSPVDIGTPPLLGQHNAEVYTQLGYTPAELVNLEGDGVI